MFVVRRIVAQRNEQSRESCVGDDDEVLLSSVMRWTRHEHKLARPLLATERKAVQGIFLRDEEKGVTRRATDGQDMFLRPL